MTMFENLLNSKSSFELAAFVVTWIALVLLTLVIVNLYARLLRMEQARGSSPATTPYSHLIGKPIEDIIGIAPADGQPQVLLFVSSGCGSCRKLLEELASPSWTVPTALLWTDAAPATAVTPPRTIALDNGAKISAELGIRVTPFGLVTDEAGQVVQAMPINSLRSLSSLNGRRPASTPNHQLSARGEKKP
jgi:hypothetical protein